MTFALSSVFILLLWLPSIYTYPIFPQYFLSGRPALPGSSTSRRSGNPTSISSCGTCACRSSRVSSSWTTWTRSRWCARAGSVASCCWRPCDTTSSQSSGPASPRPAPPTDSPKGFVPTCSLSAAAPFSPSTRSVRCIARAATVGHRLRAWRRGGRGRR